MNPEDEGARAPADAPPPGSHPAAWPAPSAPFLVAEEPKAFSPGVCVAGRLRLDRLLGTGGMGTVWLAWDERLQRPVALKVLKARPGVGAAETAPLLEEARATARLTAPGVVEIHDVGEHAGHGYIVLEYLEGGSLRERLQRRALGRVEALRIALVLAEALADAHAIDLLHCDLKPENVMFDRAGRPKVVDFGLARLDHGAATGERAPGAGTWAYLPPEAWRGGPPSAAGDVWALGLMLCEFFAGQRPWEGPFVQASRSAEPEPDPAPKPDLGDRDLTDLAAACLDRDSGSRPTAAAVAERLRALLAGSRPGTALPAAPFIGLDAYATGDAAGFAGREQEIGELVERLARQPAVAVVGHYGVGKSSLIAAGVVPRLEEQGPLLVLRVRPGLNPLDRLALAVSQQRRSLPSLSPLVVEAGEAGRVAALRNDPGLLSHWLLDLARSSGRRVLLFVDQLEELLAGSHDPTLTRTYLEAIGLAALDPAGPVRVIVTLREDRQAGVAAVEAMREMVGRPYYLAPPTARTLGAALTEPVAALGYRWDDPTFPATLAARLEGEHAALCIVQVIGASLWEQRDRARRVLIAGIYLRLGGLSGMLGAHGDAVLDATAPALRPLAGELLLRLVSAEAPADGLSEGGHRRLTRRIVRAEDLLHGLPPAAADALGHLVAHRLVVQRGESCELVHDALLERWPLLHHLVARHAGSRRLVEQLTERARRWEAQGHRPADLLGAVELAGPAGALDPAALPLQAQAWVQASRARLRRDRLRRLALVTCSLTVLAAVATAMTALWFTARRAEGRAELAAADLALDGDQAALSRTHLRRAAALSDSAAVRAGVWRLETAPTPFLTTFRESVPGVAFAGRGRYVVGTVMDKQAHAFDPSSGARQSLDLPLGGDALAGASEAAHAALGLFTTGVLLWDLDKGAATTLPLPAGTAAAVAFSPDGGLLAGLSADGDLGLWDLARGRLRATVAGVSGPKGALAFTAAGDQILVLSRDPALLRWFEATDLTPAGSRDLSPFGRTYDLAAGPGTQLATGHSGGAACRWPSPAEEPRCLFSTQGEDVYAVALSADGRLLATGGSDQAVRLWDVDRERRIATWSLERGVVRSLAFHPAAPLLLVGHGDDLRLLRLPTGPDVRFYEREPRLSMVSPAPEAGLALGARGLGPEALLWRIDDRTVQRALPTHHPAATMGQVALQPSGRHAATLSERGAEAVLSLWDTATGTLLARRPYQGPGIYELAFAGDSDLLAAGCAAVDGRAALWTWDLREEAPPRLLEGHTSVVSDICLARDGSLLVSAGEDGTLRLWNPQDGSPLQVVRARDGARLWALACSEDAHTLVTADSAGCVETRRAPDYAGQGCLDPGFAAAALALSPDLGRLAAGDQAGKVLLWDLATGQARTLGIQRTGIARLAFTADGTALLSQDDGTAWLWDLDSGAPRWGRAIPADSSPAEGRVGRRTLRGLPSGIVEEVTRGGVRDLRLADLPATAVTLIAAGPRGTALLGYADGSWGLWDLDTGARLLGGRLHGAVVGAHQEGSTLALVSELDHRETVDLAVFFVPRAELRARIDALR